MSHPGQRTFPAYRVQQEQEAASRTPIIEARTIHLDLAGRYRQLLADLGGILGDGEDTAA